MILQSLEFEVEVWCDGTKYWFDADCKIIHIEGNKRYRSKNAAKNAWKKVASQLGIANYYWGASAVNNINELRPSQIKR